MCDNHDHIHIVTLALLSLLLAHCPRHLASNIFWHIECGEQERSDGCDTRARARACVTRAISRALALDANKKKLQRPVLVPIGTSGGECSVCSVAAQEAPTTSPGNPLPRWRRVSAPDRSPNRFGGPRVLGLRGRPLPRTSGHSEAEDRCGRWCRGGGQDPVNNARIAWQACLASVDASCAVRVRRWTDSIDPMSLQTPDSSLLFC